MNQFSSIFRSKLSIEELANKIKSYKSSSENRYYMIHSENKNQIVFGKNHSFFINFLDSMDTIFKIYPTNTDGIYKIDIVFSNYKPVHYALILFFLFFVFFFNSFFLAAMIGILGHGSNLIYIFTIFVAFYIFSKKPISTAIKSEITVIKFIVKNSKRKRTN